VGKHLHVGVESDESKCGESECVQEGFYSTNKHPPFSPYEQVIRVIIAKEYLGKILLELTQRAAGQPLR